MAAVAGRPGAGPALAISLVLVAFVCAFTGLCYAELASMIPISGSAYTYTYATMGELIAWIIGWDLILEYAFANMSVSVGFAAHIVDLLDWLNIRLDPKWLSPAFLPQGLQDLAGNDIFPVGWHRGFDIPAFLVVFVLTVVLVLGIRESTRTNNIMVLIKIAAILAFVFFGISFIHPANYHPFIPNGFSGILAGGSIIFFTYIGFDAVSTASEECRNPQRDVPIGIIATLIVCTILYLGVALVLTGIVPWKTVTGDGAPVVNALKRLSLEPGGHRLHFVRLFVLIGALMGMISSILVGPVRPGTHLVRHVPRSPAAGRLQPDPPSLPHAGLRHHYRWHPRLIPAEFLTWKSRRDDQHRHTVCLYPGRLRSDGVAPQTAESPSRLPPLRRPGHSHPQHPVLSAADGWPARDYLGPLLRLAHHRPVRLCLLQPQAQRVLPAMSKRKRPQVITAAQFLEAMSHLKRPSESIRKMLRAHLNSKGRVSTMTLLAEAAGYTSFSPANLHYGTLARRIGKHLAISEPTVRVPTASDAYLSLIGDFIRRKKSPTPTGY